MENKDLDPVKLAYQIKDFINSSGKASPQSGTKDENAYYRNQKDSYSAKNRPLRDISELRMIQGFKDDDVFNIFSPYMTVHPVPAASGNKPVLVNINTAKPELIASLVPSAVGDQCREKFIKKMAQLRKKKSPFATDAKSLKNVFKDSLCYSAETGAEKNSREKWFTTHSKAFQFTIQGNTHKMQTRLKVVIERAGSGKSELYLARTALGDLIVFFPGAHRVNKQGLL